MHGINFYRIFEKIYNVKSQFRSATVLTFEFEVDEVVGKCELIHIQITVSEKMEKMGRGARLQ